MLGCCLREVSFSAVVLSIVTSRVKVFDAMSEVMYEGFWGVKSTTFGGRPVSKLIFVSVVL